MNDSFPTVVATVITTVWTLSMVLDAVWAAYDPHPTIHALMMGVAGWAFGQRYVARKAATGDERHADNP